LKQGSDILVTVEDVDGEFGIPIPQAELDRLGLGLGDSLYFEIKDGCIYLTVNDPDEDRTGS